MRPETETEIRNPPYRHVLCVYPYRRELKDFRFLPPLGLECIASAVEPFAERLELVDLRREPGHTADFIRRDTNLVCFSVNWDLEREFIYGEISGIPEKITTVVGGRHATEDPEAWLRAMPGVDAVVRGDGEEIIEEICRKTPWGRIEGLSYRENGKIYHNRNREPGVIQEKFLPCRGRRRQKYDLLINGASTGVEIDLVSSSRGCPFNCAFCSFSRNPWGAKRKWSARSPKSVADELEGIQAPIVGFTDDLFTFDMRRVERICDLIIERGIQKKYIINARLEIAEYPLILRKMEKAGFAVLLLGIESAHDKTLKSMRKGFTTRDIRRYCNVLRGTGMLKHGYFILGNIGESAEEMLQISSFAKEIEMDSISLSSLRASPYSGLDELVAETPGYHISQNRKIYSDHCPPDRLNELRRRINRDFYSLSKISSTLGKMVKHGILGFAPGIFRAIASGRLMPPHGFEKMKKQMNSINLPKQRRTS